MASVFLSYDREDTARARPIAAALERAGHSVWWDRNIKGGTQYAKAIEQALNQADAVVVLWSARSVESAWVRDEAAAGRDRGRLVPVRIDGIEPPLGFRQFQNIDLSRSTRGRSAAMAELLAALEAPGAPPADAQEQKTAGPFAARRPFSVLLLGFVVAVLTVVALVLLQPWSGRSAAPSVTVVPSDGTGRARELAVNLLVQLGSLQAAKADALQLLEPDSGANADLTFKVGSLGGAGDPRAQLFLVNHAGTLLWSREFVQPGGNEADLRQQLAYSAAQVLRCATEALAPDHSTIELPTLKLYLNGCADLSNLLAKDARALITTFKTVTDQAPAFAGGWAKLLVAEREAFRATNLTDNALRRDLLAHIRKAREIDPTMAEAYLAEEWMQAPRPILGWMRYGDEALANNPHHPEALEMHALASAHVGRMRDAVEAARRAVQVEPLSPSARVALIHAFMDSGAIDAARNELRDAERLWPGATNLLKARLSLEYQYGDPSEALRIVQSGRVDLSLTSPQLSFLRARMRTSPAAIERAIADARNAFRRGSNGFTHYVEILAAFGRQEELVRELLSVDPRLSPGVVVVMFRPPFASLHRDPRFMRIAQRFGLVEYWQESGRWPDFCSRPDLPYDCKVEAARLTNNSSSPSS